MAENYYTLLSLCSFLIIVIIEMHHGSRSSEIRHYEYLHLLYSLEHSMINIVLGSFFSMLLLVK